MTLRDDLKALIVAAQQTWEKQGRSPDQKWAVNNFVTGAADKPLLDALEQLVKRERQQAVDAAFDRLDEIDFTEGNDATIPPVVHQWMQRIADEVFPQQP